MRIETCRVPVCALVLMGLLASPTHADNIYVGCATASAIVKIDSSGNTSTFASGLGTAFFGLAVDLTGNVYATMSNAPAWIGTFVRFDASGHMSTLASGLSGPAGVALDRSGNAYEANWSGTIMKYDASGSLSTFASGISGGPHALAFDTRGNLYTTGSNIGTIEKIDSSGNVSTFASGLGQATALAFDRGGNLFVGDNTAGTILKYDSSGNRSTFASGFGSLWALAFDSSGNLFASDSVAGAIFKLDPNGNMSTFAAGLPYPMALAIQTPEPATLILAGLGGLAAMRRRRVRSRNSGLRRLPGRLRA